MKRKRIRLKPSEIRLHLQEQVRFLRASCRAFDVGDEAEAKRIASVLRTLLHDANRSRSLLSQLGKPFNWRFADSAHPFMEANIASHHGLVAIKLSNTSPHPASHFVPKCEPQESFHPFVHFRIWWNDIVFKDKPGNRFSRKDLVLTVANQDGGVHVDSELDEEYAGLSKENTLGWTFTVGGVDVSYPTNPVPASLRQIGHEVLLTLESAELIEPEGTSTGAPHV